MNFLSIFAPRVLVRNLSRPLGNRGGMGWGAVGLGVLLQGLLGSISPAQALPPSTAPAGLSDRLTALDQAAAGENLPGVLQYYSPDFLHNDGLTRSDFEQALTAFWQRFDNLTYTTQLLSWDQVNGQIITETRTEIQGTERTNDRTFRLVSQLQQRQFWQNDQIVRTEVLEEQSQLQSGEAPPTLTVSLPATVQVNQTFNFDVIVEEPLDDDLLLGAVLDEPVTKAGFMDPTVMMVEPILAGGLFKVGRAPGVQDNRWISAMIVRKGGMTFVTQRLRVLP